jgi:tetratricopeptide (TPR) repeat protein
MARDDRLDPDALAALEEERDFLLASLRDLDREFEAGDVDETDYHTLRDDYTHRAATVLAAIDRRQAARSEAQRPRSPIRIVAGVAAVVVFGLLAGLGVARAAGNRTSVDGLTGDVRATVGQMLFRCDELRSQMEVVEALECYDQVIEQHPANAEAVTSKGWTLVFAGFPDLAWPYFDQAVALDPEYADLRVYRAIVLNWWCRPEETLDELDAFDDANPLAEMRALVEDRQLRRQAEELLEVRLAEPSVADRPVPVAQSPSEEWDQCPVLADAGVLESADADADADADAAPEATTDD